MSFHFVDIARNAAADRRISEAEIAQLRRAGWADGKMTRSEAEAIFAAQHGIEEPTAQWSDFFVEAIKQYVLEGTEPRGYASESEAEWLIGQVNADGKVCSMTELELLTRIIETAKNVPDSLKQFVLKVIETEVVTGEGPTRCGGDFSATHVSEAECRILRRVIFGTASERPAAVGRNEAEMLFRIKDVSLGANNAPEFKRLFVQGIGNYLMGFAHSSGQISRERALELEAFVADNSANVGRFMREMAVSAPNAFGVVFGKKPAGVSREDQADADAAVTSAERDWLEDQIAVNGKVDEYDRALLAFIAEEAGRV